MNEFANATAAAAIDLRDQATRIAPTASMKRIDLADLPRWNVHAQRLLEAPSSPDADEISTQLAVTTTTSFTGHCSDILIKSHPTPPFTT